MLERTRLETRRQTTATALHTRLFWVGGGNNIVTVIVIYKITTISYKFFRCSAEIIDVANQEFYLFVRFNRLQASSSPNNTDCLFHLFKRVSAHPPFVCRRFHIITRRHPPAQSQFKHPTTSHQSSTPNTSAAVREDGNPGQGIDGNKSGKMNVEQF